jgi:RNA polymerase sigma factor (sigma-70 family)
LLQKKKNVLLDDIFKPNNENDPITYENFINKNESQNPERLLIRKEESMLLKAAVDRLPRIQKTLLLLFHQDELSLDEISTIVEMPLNTVKSHLFRARTSLKEMLLLK